MLHLDDVQLYDLSEAGGLLFRDPARLAREARLGRIPATRVAEGLALPAPWVDAEAGVSDADPGALSSYWLARLAPPSRDARRPLRDLARLEAQDLLEPAEAARRLCAAPEVLARLDRDGTLPALRVAGAVRYDARLIDLVADEADVAAREIDARREQVRAWARFEYGEVAAVAPPPASFRAPAPAAAQDEAERREPAPEAPKAFEIPDDLGLEDLDGPLPPGGLLEVDGFETVDED